MDELIKLSEMLPDYEDECWNDSEILENVKCDIDFFKTRLHEITAQLKAQ